MFLPFGIITKNTLKNIIQPRITPTDKNANFAPKIFVKQKEITAPIMSRTTEKITFLFINLDFQIRSKISQDPIIEKIEIPIPIKGVIFSFTLLSIIKIFAFA